MRSNDYKKLVLHWQTRTGRRHIGGGVQGHERQPERSNQSHAEKRSNTMFMHNFVEVFGSLRKREREECLMEQRIENMYQASALLKKERELIE